MPISSAHRPQASTGEAAPNESRLFQAEVAVKPGQPLVLSEWEEIVSTVSEEQRAQCRQVGLTLKAYRDAAKTLLQEKYAELREIAPAHMRGDCDCTAIICDDGIIVRYDRHSGNEPKVRVGILPERVTSFAPKFSGGFVHCSLDPATYELPPDGPRIQLFKSSSATGERTPLLEGQLAIVVPWGARRQQMAGSSRPVPYVSVTNEFTLYIQGELFKESDSAQLGTGQQFILRSHMNFTVGWQIFEVYPAFDADVWQPSVAPMWAELNLLAAVARQNLLDQQFQQLDPNAASRKQFGSLLKQFEALLDGLESPIQGFLKEHPELLSLTHIGVWPKLSFGARVTDFVFRDPSNNYLLVEIEAPIRTLFRKDGQPHEELIHAIDQVTDWLRYIEDNLPTVQRELGLTGISTSPQTLIVIGRSGNLTEENRRKLVTLQNMVPKLRIMTYDDLIANVKAVAENLFGPLWDIEGNAEVYYLPASVR